MFHEIQRLRKALIPITHYVIWLAGVIRHLGGEFFLVQGRPPRDSMFAESRYFTQQGISTRLGGHIFRLVRVIRH